MMMSSTSTYEKNTVILESSDGVRLEVDESIAFQSLTIKRVVKDMSVSAGDHPKKHGIVIPLPNVKSEILSMVIEYCDNQHMYGTDSLKHDKKHLADLINAGDYLQIELVRDLQDFKHGTRSKTEVVGETYSVDLWS
ncbi:hypothetical protein GIB67_036641 [Kingdonia uniflora]|uniref:SKP1 component POZ domain-containing protein n=1 Tax=Kingdonia uniflora TaxID=39325 RepID=A0A7J7LWI7_9MAGN|nr:hypothetical protein GIB67_036641 [Kingdonia uniflora]